MTLVVTPPAECPHFCRLSIGGTSKGTLTASLSTLGVPPWEANAASPDMEATTSAQTDPSAPILPNGSQLHTGPRQPCKAIPAILCSLMQLPAQMSSAS